MQSNDGDILRAVIEGMTDAVAVFDADLCLITVNVPFRQEVKRIWGFEARIGDRVETVLAHLPGELTKTTSLLRRSLQGECFTIIEKFGDPAVLVDTFKVTFRPIQHAEGTITGVTVCAHNLTRQIRLEESLQQANADLEWRVAERTASLAESEREAARMKSQLEAVFQALNDGIVVFDMAGHAVLLNQAEAKIIGISKAKEMLMDLSDYAKTYELSDIVSGRVLALDQWPISRVLRGEFLTDVQLKGRRLDTGQEWFFSFGAQPVYEPSGKQILGVVVTRDITKAMINERSLRNAVEKLNLALEAAQMGTYDFNPNTGEVNWDARSQSLFGLQPLESPPYSQALGLVHVDDRARIDAAVQRAIAPGSDGRFDEEFRVVWPNGSLHWIRSQGQAYFTVPSQPAVRMAGTHIDITKRKQAEEAMRESETQQREAADLLRISDQRKDDFLGVLSHELRNPLAPIRNALYVLDQSAPNGDQARRAKAIIDRQITHMGNLIDDLLDLTRISRGKIHLHRERIDLAQLVRCTVEDMRSLFTTAGVGLDVKLIQTPLYVNGDATRLAQITGNLLQNAAKFTARGGKATLTLDQDQAAHEAIIRVTDYGIGFSKEMLPQLFQAFSQADTTLARSPGGLGLGLALVKGLVDLHGGSVKAESAGIGQGAVFTVRFPLDSSMPAQMAPGSALAAYPRRRVLIVEDYPDAAESLRMVLEMKQHTVAVATSGLEAISLAHSFHPDVILSDIGLPGMDGYQVAQAIRADAQLQGTHLIALSGYALPADLEKARQAGFEMHLAKPPSMDSLEKAIAELTANG